MSKGGRVVANAVDPSVKPDEFFASSFVELVPKVDNLDPSLST
jgi:hypothetical protein